MGAYDNGQTPILISLLYPVPLEGFEPPTSRRLILNQICMPVPSQRLSQGDRTRTYNVLTPDEGVYQIDLLPD